MQRKDVARSADKAKQATQQTGERVENSHAFELLVGVGLLAYGIVHLLVAWLAGQLAWTGNSQEASQKGAFQEMADTPVGDVLLWTTAVGLFALAVWQGFEAAWGHRDREEGRKRIVKRLASAGKAVLYAGLGVSAVSTAAGTGSSGDDTQKTLTAQLMSTTAGRILVILIGLAVVVAGGRLSYRGVAEKFTRDLEGGVSQAVIRLGQVGYSAKGAALAIVGVLFVIAAVTFDPDKAGGLDTALRTLRAQPYGAILLTVMAVGLACFGLYCCAWSRHFKRT